MMTQHTVSAFEEDMNYLRHRIAEMGGHAEAMISEATKSLSAANLDLARKVIKDDMFLDDGQRDIDDRAVLLIAQRQPMAIDLREVFANIRISSDLERIGDMAKGIAKRVTAINAENRPMLTLVRGMEHLSEMVLVQLKDALDAYANRSVDGVESILLRDEEIDAVYTSLFRELLTYMMEDPRNISTCTHLLFCAKNLERIGDHTTNIAEAVYYIVKGEKLPAARSNEDKSHRVSVDLDDAK